MTSNNQNTKIPRIELNSERSGTLESIQSLTRAIRESFRLHSVRREKKKRAKRQIKNDSGFLDVGDNRRARSKSMDEQGCQEPVDTYNEISDISISGVVASDFGPRTDFDKPEDVFEDAENEADQGEQQINPELAPVKVYSKSLGENLHYKGPKKEEVEIQQRKSQQHLSLDIVEESNKSNIPQRQQSMPGDATQNRRSSKDDGEGSKVEASVLRKRFARLMDTLRAHKFSVSNSVEEQNENTLSTSPAQN